MLLIGDIHIHHRNPERLIQMLDQFVQDHPDETNILLMGDYVYHFSYHRHALMSLLDLFIQWANQDKKVYILAGNHDRLGQHFVYTEAQKILYTIPSVSTNLFFITEPLLKEIEEANILFIPYKLNRSSYTTQSSQYNFDEKLLACEHSNNTTNQMSFILNAYVADMVAEIAPSADKPLTIIHHYYTAGIQFPGLKTTFGYAQGALSPQRLEHPHLRLISGHIHHPFVYNNYLCVGSVWSTSPLETNTNQYLFVRNGSKKLISKQVAHNPYLTIKHDADTMIDTATINNHWQALHEEYTSRLLNTHRASTVIACEYSAQHTTITLIVNDGDYTLLDDYIASDIRESVQHIKLQQPPQQLDMLIDAMIDTQADFQSSWSNWKALLEDYLTTKYGENKQKYIDQLEQLRIL